MSDLGYYLGVCVLERPYVYIFRTGLSLSKKMIDCDEVLIVGGGVVRGGRGETGGGHCGASSFPRT